MKHCLLFSFFFILAIKSHGQITKPYDTAWVAIFGDSACYEEGFDIAGAGNGNILVSAGYRCSGAPFAWKGLLLQLNEHGDTIRTRKEAAGLGDISHIQSGYINLRKTHNSVTLDSLISLKLNQDGSVVWSNKFFGQGCYHEPGEIIPAADGGYAFTGFFSAVNCASPRYQGILVKQLSSGQQDWVKYYAHDTLNIELYRVRQLPDNGYALFGWIGGGGSSERNMYLVRTNSVGDTIWTKRYGRSGADTYGFGMDATSDGGFILSGYDDSIRLIKTNSIGNVQWEKAHGLSNGGAHYKSLALKDGGFAFTAITSDGNKARGLLIKTDSNGNELWRTFAPNDANYFRGITETSDSALVATGSFDRYPTDPFNNASDLFVVKYNYLLNTGIANLTGGYIYIEVSPNPVRDKATIKLPKNTGEFLIFSIYNLTGQKLSEQKITGSNILINSDDFKPGLYFLTLHDNNGINYRGKFAVQ